MPNELCAAGGGGLVEAPPRQPQKATSEGVREQLRRSQLRGRALLSFLAWKGD